VERKTAPLGEAWRDRLLPFMSDSMRKANTEAPIAIPAVEVRREGGSNGGCEGTSILRRG
jgi:hypothetical protein